MVSECISFYCFVFHISLIFHGWIVTELDLRIAWVGLKVISRGMSQPPFL